ncbi:ABC transporter permease [Agrobacterium sp. LAD9]|uniref:ABC transporter permease n=1 Tax=Agrobacterium sp. LAD9 TaxID=2055153 RepID=UPI000D1F62E8|nr:ABC transporter permease [Agrobacterium sp. LAD9]
MSGALKNPGQSLPLCIARTRVGRGWTPEAGLRLLIILPAIFLVPTFIVPLTLVIFRGFGGTDPSIGQLAAILGNSVYLHVLVQTFKTAFISTFLALLIGFPIAHVISTARPIWAKVGFALVMVPFWTSVVTRTYAWIALLSRKGLINSALLDLGWIDQPLKLMYNSFGVQVGMVQVLMPMMILPLLSTMRQIDRTKLLAGEILGANPIQTFVHIYLPLCLPGIVAGCLLVFITALGFYVTPVLMGSDGNMMIAVLIEQQITQTLNWPLASALATILLISVMLSLWLIVMIANRLGIRMTMS